MTQLVRLKTGDEYDALTKGGRRYHRPRAGTRAWIKRKFRSGRGTARLQDVGG